MTEQTFLEHGSVQVTKTRFIVPGETYAVNGIISVKTTETFEEIPTSFKEKITTLAVSWLIFGIFLTGAYLIHQDTLGTLIGLFLLFLSWSVLVGKKKVPTYSVTLRTSSGEVKALESPERQFIQEVTQAINQAIVARG